MIQARRNRKMSADNRKPVSTGLREILFFSFCFASLYLFVSLVTYNPLDMGWSHSSGTGQEVTNKGGVAGAIFADVFFYLFGYFAYLFAFMVGHVGWLIYQGKHHDLLAEPKHLIVPGIGFILTLSAGCGLAIVHFTAESALLPSHAGGILGTVIGRSLESIFSPLGATLLLLALFFTGITLLTGLSWLKLMDFLGHHTLRLLPIAQAYLRRWVWPVVRRYSAWLMDKTKILSRWLLLWSGDVLRTQWQTLRQQYARKRGLRQDEVEDYIDDEDHYLGETGEITPSPSPIIPLTTPSVEQLKEPSEGVSPSTKPPDIPVLTDKVLTPALSKREDFSLPSPSCLESPPVKELPPLVADSLNAELSRILNQLHTEAEVKSITPGPVVCRVEIAPGKNVTAAFALELAEQLTHTLTRPGLRLVEVSPLLIRLEIPNLQKIPITLSSLLNSAEYAASSSFLSLALGVEVSGQPVIVDLSRLPHLLLAGSAAEDIDRALYTLLLSLLYKATPYEMRLILIDRSQHSLSLFTDLPHLLTPIVSQMPQVEQSFRWCVAEMERRYRLMADLGVRNIDGYNQKVKESATQEEPELIPLNLSPIPYIVVIAHEVADLAVGAATAEIEENITRLTQKARAAGIHLLLATRHPSVNVVTGLLKANFPTRLVFQVNNPNESRHLLGHYGAETLLGNGDMLYLTPSTSQPVRLHGPQISLQEVKNVLQELEKQHPPRYEDLSVEG